MHTLSDMQTPFEKRRDERGAALITALLITTLLLVAGGALIVTTSLSASNAVESTAEAQAYYAAEAGLQTTLDILRGNGTPNPTGVTLDFRKAITLDTNYYSNKSGDPSTVPRLSRWLTYSVNGDHTSANSRVSLGNNSSFTVQLYDPDNTPVAKQPNRLLVIVKGYGPKGAQKELRMFVNRMAYDIPVPAPIVIRGADDGITNMTFNLGDSNTSNYSGVDAYGVLAERPTVVVSYHDRNKAAIALTDGPNIGTEQLGILDYNAIPKGTAYVPPTSSQSATWIYATAPAKNASTPAVTIPVKTTTATPDFLVTADAARAFLNKMQVIAQQEDRYFTSLTGYAGSTNPYTPVFTFVDGNCNLDGGAGLLIVTGNLVLNGGVNFKGLILVLGNGSVTKSGGGGSDEFGSFMVAKFARTWPASENGLPHNFLAPSFDVSGSGNSTIQSHSKVEQEANETTGRIVTGIVER
ncbi:MAG: hypothetical protein ICV60_18300 [Pyrinomonadaceae bacterium]|nr:hypothetical protein [Pyrinomonadaceae bacterium]